MNTNESLGSEERVTNAPSSPLPTPKRIKQLDKVVVNRIAAGEVIHRPAHALKELLENSIDAGATSIQISIKDGGLKALIIQDNGCGIESEDLHIVCERFTTSKLTKFEDLSSIATYGFRGEALASISHVAHLTITSRTSTSPCAYKAIYSDGLLVPERAGMSSQPQACAGNIGTTITVQDLFYNVKSRLKALHSKSREHSYMLDVVSRYAIHNAGIAISLKKVGTNQVEINTQPNASIIDNIRMIFGNVVAKELLELNGSEENFSFSCYFTNPNFSSKKFNFLVFINNRMVDSNALKRAFDSIFNPLLPKGMHPFIYLSLTLPPATVDVNVHPTKKEVYILNESAVIETLSEKVQSTLMKANQSRHYQVHSLLPAFPSTSNTFPTLLEQTSMAAPNTFSKPFPTSNYRPDYMVRTDSRSSTLDAWFFKLKQPIPSTNTIEWRDLGLSSIQELQDEALNECDQDLHSILSQYTFVGFATGPYVLMQSGTYLYLLNIIDLCCDFFYLRFLALFSNYPAINLQTPFSIEEISLQIISQEKIIWEKLTISPENAAKKMSLHLISQSDMLQDYFSITVSSSGHLTALPCVIQGYIPPTSQIPFFLVRLCTEINWEDEKQCLQGILKELALLYTPTTGDAQVIEHVILSEMRDFYPNRLSRSYFTEIANLHELYKVFERC